MRNIQKGVDMSIVASVVDGVIQDTTSSTTSSTSSSDSSTLDKDDFLQLLVAQMKYQDPLEPTSNTEYISQYATFSQIEQMQNMSASMDLDRASSLVGEYVYMKTTNETTGSTSYVYGKVDYVQIENGEAYLSINGSLYSLDDLDSVVDEEYMSAYEKAKDLVSDIADLPTVANLTIDDKDAVDAINTTYSAMSDYEKSFIATDTQTLIESYISKMEELETTAEETAETLVTQLTTALSALPSVDSVTLSDKEAIEAANKIYTGMNSYQQNKVSSDTKTLLTSYVNKLAELEAAATTVTEDTDTTGTGAESTDTEVTDTTEA